MDNWDDNHSIILTIIKRLSNILSGNYRPKIIILQWSVFTIYNNLFLEWLSGLRQNIFQWDVPPIIADFHIQFLEFAQMCSLCCTNYQFCSVCLLLLCLCLWVTHEKTPCTNIIRGCAYFDTSSFSCGLFHECVSVRWFHISIFS